MWLQGLSPRMLVGRVQLVVFLAAVVGTMTVMDSVQPVLMDRAAVFRQGGFNFWAWRAVEFGIVVLVTIIALYRINGPFLKRGLARILEPLRRSRRMRDTGEGGTAAFAATMDEWNTGFVKGKSSIFLARSLHDPKWQVGSDHSNHQLTIALTGAGKGRSVIIPNLLMWQGSALVVDPKGTNAAVQVTAGAMAEGEFEGNGSGRLCPEPVWRQ